MKKQVEPVDRTDQLSVDEQGELFPGVGWRKRCESQSQASKDDESPGSTVEPIFHLELEV